MSDDEEDMRQLGGRTKQPHETVARVIQLGEAGENLHDIIDVLASEKMRDSNGREFEPNDKTIQGKLDVLRRILWAENIVVGTNFHLSGCAWLEETLSKVESFAKLHSQPLSVQQVHQSLHDAGCKC